MPSDLTTPETEALAALFRDLLRFADAAAGEGITIVGAPDPGEALCRYAAETGDESCETYADRLPAALSALSAARREAEEARERGGWRDMDTAPKDGRRVLVEIDGVDRAVLAEWDGSAWITIDGTNAWKGRAVLAWHPVPALRADSTRGESPDAE